jgi:hypothetical protein
MLRETTTSTIIPGTRPRDALKMIGWLARAFGFEKLVTSRRTNEE